MFNLTQSIANNATPPSNEKGLQGCSLFYQTTACVDLINEVFQFEGWQTPSCTKLTTSNDPIEASSLENMVILELSQSNNVVEDALHFASRIPNQKGVVVIGKEDAISTLRSLKALGFYYLFWPISTPEITEFLRHVNNNQQQFVGVSHNRKAKRIAVIGTKGGVGTSLIASELSACFAAQQTETILIDRQYRHSNIDILLGLKKYQKYDANNLGFQLHDLNESNANDYLTKISPNLKALALEGNESIDKLEEYTNTIADLLLRSANFIIDDFSASLDSPLLLDNVIAKSDIIVLMIEPTIASIRTAQAHLEYLSAYAHTHRVVVLLNIHRPLAAFALTQAEIETYLDRPVDVVVPFNKHLATALLDGKRMFERENATGAITTLAMTIKGQKSKATTSVWHKLKAVFQR